MYLIGREEQQEKWISLSMSDGYQFVFCFRCKKATIDQITFCEWKLCFGAALSVIFIDFDVNFTFKYILNQLWSHLFLRLWKKSLSQ